MATTPTSTGSTAQINRGTEAARTPDLQGDANALMDEAKSAAGMIADEAKDQAAKLTDRAKDELSGATEKVKSLAGDQKDAIAEQMGGVAEAIGKAASDLEQRDGTGAHYARMIADNAEKLSDTIRNNDIDQLLRMAQDFGRKQPALFVGAAALLGFAASRFVLASANRQDEQMPASDTGPAYQEYGGEPASSVGNGSVTGGA